MDQGRIINRTVPGLHKYFTALDLIYPEDNRPVHDRWMQCLFIYPECRERHLGQSFADLYQKALDGYLGFRLHGVYDLSILQLRFWHLMGENHMCLQPELTLAAEQLHNWQRRLGEKLQRSDALKRVGTRVRKGRDVKEVKPSLWLH